MKTRILISVAAMILFSDAFMLAQASVDSTQVRESKPLEQLLVYENPRILMTIGDITYNPKNVGTQVKNGVMGVLGGNELPMEDESMVALAKNALETGATKSFRIQALESMPTEEQMKNNVCMKFTSTITGCNTTVMLRDRTQDKRVMITACIYLTDLKSGEIVASQIVSGESWASSFTSFQKAKEWAAHNLMVRVWNQLNSWYPLHGHMLDKGFMKGRKQKLKEIYIDLGSNNNLDRNYDVNIYTVKRIVGRIARRYIGRGIVAEVLGEDISSVKLTKGAADIKEAFDNGAEIAVCVF